MTTTSTTADGVSNTARSGRLDTRYYVRIDGGMSRPSNKETSFGAAIVKAAKS